MHVMIQLVADFKIKGFVKFRSLKAEAMSAVRDAVVRPEGFLHFIDCSTLMSSIS